MKQTIKITYTVPKILEVPKSMPVSICYQPCGMRCIPISSKDEKSSKNEDEGAAK